MDGFIPFDKLKEIDILVKSDLFPSVFNLWEGNKYKSNILKYKKDYNGYHPTQKPVMLLEDLVKTFSNEGNLVVDLTMGGGSTGVACVNTNRDFIGIELNEGYFTIAEKRIKEAQSQGVLLCPTSRCRQRRARQLTQFFSALNPKSRKLIVSGEILSLPL